MQARSPSTLFVEKLRIIPLAHPIAVTLLRFIASVPSTTYEARKALSYRTPRYSPHISTVPVYHAIIADHLLMNYVDHSRLGAVCI